MILLPCANHRYQAQSIENLATRRRAAQGKTQRPTDEQPPRARSNRDQRPASLIRAVDVRTEHADQSPNQALMRLRAYRKLPATSEDANSLHDDPHADPHADIEA